MAVIRISADELNQYYHKILEIKAQLEAVLKTIDECIERLATEWSGASYDEYKKQYDEIRATVVKLIDYINSFAEAMSKTIENFNRVDADLASAIGSSLK